MNNPVFRKTLENVRKQRDIKLVTTERKINCLMSRTKLSYYKVFHKKIISNRNEKTDILMNKPVHLGLSILELCKILMHGF